MTPTPRTLLPHVLQTLLACACAAPPATEPTPPQLENGAQASAAPLVAMRPPRPLMEDGSFYVLGEDPAHPRLRYLDGQVALNTTCAIQIGNKLSRKVPPAYVNGQPIGFC